MFNAEIEPRRLVPNANTPRTQYAGIKGTPPFTHSNHNHAAREIESERGRCQPFAARFANLAVTGRDVTVLQASGCAYDARKSVGTTHVASRLPHQVGKCHQVGYVYEGRVGWFRFKIGSLNTLNYERTTRHRSSNLFLGDSTGCSIQPGIAPYQYELIT